MFPVGLISMPDLVPTKTRSEYDWTHRAVHPAGTRIQVIVAGRTLLDVTVPAGKSLQGTIVVQGELVTP